MNDVTLIIKTFERPDALDRLLQSIGDAGYGACPVLVADDSKSPYKDAILDDHRDIVDDYIVLPYDSGVSKGRNELLKRVDTPYFVANDDDFVFHERTDLGWMRRQIEASSLHLIGGTVDEPRHYEPLRWRAPFQSVKMLVLRTLVGRPLEHNDWYGHFEREGDALRFFESSASPDPYVSCDLTLQFFLAETNPIRDIGGWAEELKSFGEHWEFFYRARQGGLHVGFSNRVGVKHLPTSSPTYHAHRFEREQTQMQQAMALHNVKVIEFYTSDGGLARRYESDA